MTPPMPLTPEQQAEIDAQRTRPSATRRADRAGARGDPLPGRCRCSITASSASSTTWATTAPIVQAARVSYGTGTAQGQRGSRADPLSDAPPPLDAVRDVRDQVPREAADLRGAAVDPAPHRQRERVFGALFDPRQRVLPARRPSIWRRSRQANRQGRGEVLDGAEAAARARAAARGCRARLRALHGDAERARGRATAIEPGRSGPRARAGAHEPVARTSIPNGTGRSICTICCISSRCAPIPTRSTRSAPMPRRCSDIVKRWVPLTYEAFEQHRLGAVTLSAAALRW